MPITVDLEQSPFLRQLFEAACARVLSPNAFLRVAVAVILNSLH
ncbi:hypothetical protein [Bradyrhizobium sp. AZCC 2289]